MFASKIIYLKKWLLSFAFILLFTGGKHFSVWKILDTRDENTFNFMEMNGRTLHSTILLYCTLGALKCIISSQVRNKTKKS